MRKLQKINESDGTITYDEMLSKVQSDLGGSFKKGGGKYMGDPFGNSTTFVATNNGNEEYYSFTEDTKSGAVELSFLSKKIITGRSLADPSKRYQTTSATTFKTEKKKTQKSVKNAEAAYKSFQQFREKYKIL